MFCVIARDRDQLDVLMEIAVPIINNYDNFSLLVAYGSNPETKTQ